jgi:hypothetical protein
MSAAFKCDHCRKYFDSRGSHRFAGEVCDKDAGFVRYRPVMFVFPSVRKSTGDYDTSEKEFCASCIKAILLAALNEVRL